MRTTTVLVHLDFAIDIGMDLPRSRHVTQDVSLLSTERG